MRVQLGNNLKVFLTTNINSQGKVQTSGFTADNTQEIFLVTESLSVQQIKSLQYIDNHSFLDSTKKLETVAKPDLDIGSISFSTMFNSSNSGAFDKLLWNALTNNSSYPGNIWTITDTFESMKLIRNTNATTQIGILIFTDELVYVFDAVRVESLNLSFDITSLLVNNWSCKFETEKILNANCQSFNSELYELSGELTGFLKKSSIQDYTWATAKLAKISVKPASETISGLLASTSFNISIANNQSYIQNNSMSRQKLSQRYVDAGSMSVTGDLTFYTRGPGSYSNELVQEVDKYRDDPYYLKTYDITVEILSTNSTKLCDIQLNSCNLLQVTSEFSNVLSDKLDFKVVDESQAQNCFIKFYT